MGNYNKYGPFTDSAAPGIDAVFLNNVENVFVQPSGGTESGHYTCVGSGYVDHCIVSTHITSLSRTTTLVSVTIDTSDFGAFGCGSPTTNRLTSGGVEIYVYSSGAQTSCGCGGVYTLQY